MQPAAPVYSWNGGNLSVSAKGQAMRTARILRKALLSRRVDERLLELFAQGKLGGTIHTCIGQEFSGAVLSEFLQPQDVVFSGHRCHGHFLSQIGDVPGLMAELMGKSSGVCQGWGGSQHLHRPGFFSNGILGGGSPIAAGVALAKKMGRSQAITCSFLGDGALGEGVIYETFNLCSKWQLPLLFIIEDNGIAQSTAQSQTLAGSLRMRPEAFGIEVLEGNTWDWEGLIELAEESVQAVRRQGCPRVLLIKTYRLMAHSKGDDTRAVAEIEDFRARDPLSLALQSGQLGEALRSEIEAEVEAAIGLAEASGYASLPTLSVNASELAWQNCSLPEGKVGKLLNQALAKALAEDEKLILLGEDIESPYGGAFKVTEGLSLDFPDRVRNTPISEATLVGTGLGLALEGFRPFVEIMFGDFLGLAFDQLVNHAAKFPQMYAGQVKANLVVRTPMGGRRGYGPTHSQSLEKHFLGVPGLQVVALNSLTDPATLVQQLRTSECGPTLLVENKLLYACPLHHRAPPGFELLHSQEDYPVAWLRPKNAGRLHLTLMGYGGMTDVLLQASEQLFDEHELLCQVVVPSRLYPFAARDYLAVFQGAEALLLCEEGQGFGGFASEVLAQLGQISPAPCRRLARVGPQPYCIAASPVLERELLPGLERVVGAALELCR